MTRTDGRTDRQRDIYNATEAIITAAFAGGNYIIRPRRSGSTVGL